MSWIEIVGFLTGAASVWLAAREHVWNWPIGLVNSACWLALFWSSQLYLDSGLQLVYIGLGIAGWYWWLHGGEGRDDLPITRTPLRTAAVLAVLTVAATGALWWVDAVIAGSALPFWDASTTVVSLVATYLLCRKHLGNWVLWIAVDVAYVGMYVAQHLYLTAALQPLFIAMCVSGLVGWRRTLAGTAAPTDAFDGGLELGEAAA
jgi:nicotinamide mononucleotide transporter